jgi:small subunit ribosomal protein S7
MARRRRANKRQINPDAKFESVLVGRLISTVMRCGKRSLAERIVYAAIEEINKNNKDGNPLEVLNKAMDNVKPRLEVKSRRVGGATYPVPMEVPQHRSEALALRWICDSAAKRKGMPMKKSLAVELDEASKGQGNAVRKKDDLHKMAQANRAFAHFRF